MKKQRYISYSLDFRIFLSELRGSFSESVVAIYGRLPKCKICGKALKIYGERIDLKNRSRTYLYRCLKCGWEKLEVIDIDDTIPNVKIRVIIKPLTEERFFKLHYENIFIAYSTLDSIQQMIRAGIRSELISILNDSVLLYGQDVLKLKVNNKSEDFKDGLQYYEKTLKLFTDKMSYQ